MRTAIPSSVLETPPATLSAVFVPPSLTLFVHEDQWGLKKYAPDAKAGLRLGVWEFDKILVSVITVRIGQSDLTTFDCSINVGTPPGVRIMQCLAAQSRIELLLVTNQAMRSWPMPNTVRSEADALVQAVRLRRAWGDAEYRDAMNRLNRLYPTAHSLWRARDTWLQPAGRPRALAK